MMMHKNTLDLMYYSIPRSQVRNLIVRVIQGLIMIICTYTCVKYLPLVFVSLIYNLSPLLTALFSYFFYSIGLSRIDTLVLVLSFLGVVLLVTGSLTEENSATSGVHVDESTVNTQEVAA